MDFDGFKKIFNEEGIGDEKLIKEKWAMAQIFEGADNLDEDTLRWSIKHYMAQHIAPRPN